MSIIEDITALMLKDGEAAAQEQRERIAADEEERQGKHRLLRNTLKGIAMFAPYFIPGAGIIPALGRFGASAGIGMMNNRGIGSDEDRYQEYR